MSLKTLNNKTIKTISCGEEFVIALGKDVCTK